MRQKQRVVFGYATVTQVGTNISIMVQHDGQPNSIPATAQYVGPVVGDRVTLMTIGRTVFATGVTA